jgi:hypothetical protein
MATRPKVHREEVRRAIARVAQRRSQIDDSHREALPDSPESDPREVLDYLRAHSGQDIPLWVLQADVGDALTMNNWLWWEDRRRELHFLRAGIARGMYLNQIGAQVGVGKQGVRDRIDRLDALLRYDRPDEKIMRRERRSEHETAPTESAEPAWLNRHRDALFTVIAGLTDYAAELHLKDPDREWLDELAADARDGAITPATIIILGLAAAELRTAPAVLALPANRPRPIHELLAQAEALRASFAALGARG